MASAETTPRRSWRIASPRTAKLILWGGVAVSFAGFLVAAFAFTDPRIYDVRYFPVMIGGVVLMFGGMLVAGYARAMGPRGLAGKQTTARPRRARAPASRGTIAPSAPFAPTAASVKDKALAVAPAVPPAPAPAATAVASAPVPKALERLHLKCPQCKNAFSAEGTRPFRAECPNCHYSAEIR